MNFLTFTPYKSMGIGERKSKMPSDISFLEFEDEKGRYKLVGDGPIETRKRVDLPDDQGTYKDFLVANEHEGEDMPIPVRVPKQEK